MDGKCRNGTRALGIVLVAIALAGCSRGMNGESRLGRAFDTPGRQDGGGYYPNGPQGSGPGGGIARGDLNGSPFSPSPGTPGSGDTVYFTSDSVDLTPEARETLGRQVQWLRTHPQNAVLVEGHADERGTREYNIGLGARRSETVRNYLISQGIPNARIRTSSLGKERPVATCPDISCWSQNRRAQTVLVGAQQAGR